MKKPTFLLKPSAYKTDKLYAIAPADGGGDGSVSGYVGNGTRINKGGRIEAVATDTPRIDYKQGHAGVLLEPTRKNFLAGSNSDDIGVTSATLVSQAIPTPFSIKGSRVKDISNSVAGYAYYTGTALDDNTAVHTCSVFVKFGDTDTISFGIEGGTFSRYIILDLDRNGNLTANTNATWSVLSLSSGTQQFVHKYADGWFRVGFSWTMSVEANVNLRVYPCGYTDVSQQGYCYVGEAQVEEGSGTTSYIPSVSSTTTTRTSETIALGTTSFLPPVQDIVGETRGAVLVHFTVENPPSVGASSTTPFFTFGSSNGRISLRRASGGFMTLAKIENVDTTETDVFIGDEDISLTSKVLFNISDTNVDVWVDGVNSGSTSKDFAWTSNNPSLSGAGQQAWIHEIAMWREPLTDAEALKVTT